MRFDSGRFRQFDRQVAIGLTAAWAPFEPVMDFTFHFAQRLLTRGRGHAYGADIRSGVFGDPQALFLPDLANNLHGTKGSRLQTPVHWAGWSGLSGTGKLNVYR